MTTDPDNSSTAGTSSSRPSAHNKDGVSCFRVGNETRATEIGDRIELAGDGARRRKGLLGRTGLDAGEGLWIAPCEAVHTFGMQFNLDLIYLNRKHRVLKVREHVPRNRLSACFTAHSILELPPGTIERTKTEPGDTLTFERL